MCSKKENVKKIEAKKNDYNNNAQGYYTQAVLII